jgi:type II secretory pathway pseudopilin PulG
MKKVKGVIALTTLLVVTAILLFSGLTLLITSSDLTQSVARSSRALLAEVYAKSCLEEAMYKISRDSNYTGTVTNSFSDGNCQAAVTNGGSSSTKNIALTANSGTYNYSRSYVADSSTNPLSLN